MPSTKRYSIADLEKHGRGMRSADGVAGEAANRRINHRYTAKGEVGITCVRHSTEEATQAETAENIRSLHESIGAHEPQT